MMTRTTKKHQHNRIIMEMVMMMDKIINILRMAKIMVGITKQEDNAGRDQWC